MRLVKWKVLVDEAAEEAANKTRAVVEYYSGIVQIQYQSWAFALQQSRNGVAMSDAVPIYIYINASE
jgi:hypothetical protein